RLSTTSSLPATRTSPSSSAPASPTPTPPTSPPTPRPSSWAARSKSTAIGAGLSTRFVCAASPTRSARTPHEPHPQLTHRASWPLEPPPYRRDPNDHHRRRPPFQRLRVPPAPRRSVRPAARPHA